MPDVSICFRIRKKKSMLYNYNSILITNLTHVTFINERHIAQMQCFLMYYHCLNIYLIELLMRIDTSLKKPQIPLF